MLRNRLSLNATRLTDKAVLVLQAPAGFGKTQLLAQWRREWLAQGGVVVWLSLDEQDVPSRLAQGLAVAKAVGSGRPVIAQGAPQRLSQEADELGELTSWLAEIADLGAETLLILDDVHHLPDTTLRHSLPYLLRNAPANLHIALASRGRFGQSTPKLLIHGQFRSISSEELRFTLDETLALLAARFDQRLELDDRVRLHEITEGWPLGLQLAISALEHATDLHAATRELGSSGGNLQQHLVDSLLARLSPQQTDFLTRISLFEMIHPELCLALLGDARAPAWLQELLNSTPILIESVDSDWLRIHPLAQELLRQRFAALPDSERRVLHQRAADWLAAHDLREAAAQQALLAGQTDQAYALAESCLYELMLRGHLARVLDWVKQLPSAEVERRPRLRLAVAWSLASSELQAEALRLAEQIGGDPQASDEQHCEAAAIAATAALFADQPDRSLSIIGPWLQKPPPRSSNLQAVMTNHRARLALSEGQPELTRHYCQQAQRSSGGLAMDIMSGHREWIIGLSYFWEGQMLSAERVLRASLSKADQELGRRSGIAVLLATALASVLLERDALEEAGTILANRMDVLAHLAAPEGIMLGHLTAARLAALQGQAHRAHDLLNELFALGETRQMPRLSIASLAEQIRLHALRGHSETCQSLWLRLERRLPDFVRQEQGLLGPELALYAQLAQAYAAVAREAWRDLLPPLEQAARLAEQLRRGRESVQVKLLQALARQRLGEDGLPLLREALSLAAELGLQRVLVDTHPQLSAWAAQAATAGPAPQAATGEPPRAPRVTASASVSPSRMLTPKEREILQLLTQNLSNKQIAQALDVGEETVKWHMKNLLSKFQAGNRKHLVDRAYLLGILQP
ncbi:helix-turn-helix transcriptional regulator [Pseudomonas sp. N040]|uniref:helix-turn-helix transcriptional regulator n=1 Tax=Pseudomonas sp. N040 TaxID=2785325 RepID=UPI001E4D1B1A|nr:LuxR C-terminal-related transcriptional regulator [Pseudomonas sp. N040]